MIILVHQLYKGRQLKLLARGNQPTLRTVVSRFTAPRFTVHAILPPNIVCYINVTISTMYKPLIKNEPIMWYHLQSYSTVQDQRRHKIILNPSYCSVKSSIISNKMCYKINTKTKGPGQKICARKVHYSV